MTRAGAIRFFTAARGHHADIGGITPGSMPPKSRTIDEEGVLFRNFLLVEGSRFREREFAQRSAEARLRRAIRTRMSVI